jgi:hypothetical protein
MSFFITFLAVDTHHLQVIGRKPPLLSLSGFARLKENTFTYRRACGNTSLWRVGKTKPEWNQGRRDSTKQESCLARGGVPFPVA